MRHVSRPLTSDPWRFVRTSYCKQTLLFCDLLVGQVNKCFSDISPRKTFQLSSGKALKIHVSGFSQISCQGWQELGGPRSATGMRLIADLARRRAYLQERMTDTVKIRAGTAGNVLMWANKASTGNITAIFYYSQLTNNFQQPLGCSGEISENPARAQIAHRWSVRSYYLK